MTVPLERYYIGAFQGSEELLRCSCAQGRKDQTELFWTVQRAHPAMQGMCPPLMASSLYSSFAAIMSLILQNSQKPSLRWKYALSKGLFYSRGKHTIPKTEPPDQFSSMFARAPAGTQHFMDFVVDAFPSPETRNTGFVQGFLHIQEFLSWSTPDFQICR